MATNTSTIPSPPPLTGDPSQDAAILTNWAWDLYKVIVIEQQIPTRLNAMADLAPLATEISASPTQAEVEEIRDKVNAIITAAAPATA